jgi:hypothetical protein
MRLDPALGLIHNDTRYRVSIASDLMEPVRPVVDKVVLESLTGRELERGNVVETREGVCRLGPELARQLGASALQLRSSPVRVVGQVRRRLLAGGAGGLSNERNRSWRAIKEHEVTPECRASTSHGLP